MTGHQIRSRASPFDITVYEIAPLIRKLQARGIRKISALADTLNQDEETDRHWSYSTMRRVLMRGSELGETLPPRSLSRAASERPYVHRRPKHLRLSETAVRLLAANI